MRDEPLPPPVSRAQQLANCVRSVMVGYRANQFPLDQAISVICNTAQSLSQEVHDEAITAIEEAHVDLDIRKDIVHLVLLRRITIVQAAQVLGCEPDKVQEVIDTLNSHLNKMASDVRSHIRG